MHEIRCDESDNPSYVPVAGTRLKAGQSIFFDDLGLGQDDLATAVVAVLGDVMTQVRLPADGVGSQLLGGQRIVGTTLAAA